MHPCIEFNDSGDDNAGEEDIKVVTVNITVNEMISGECAQGAAEVRPCPPLLPAFGSGRASNTNSVTMQTLNAFNFLNYSKMASNSCMGGCVQYSAP